MSLMTRMLRLCKADLHGVMDQLEDRSLLLKQCLRDMEKSLQLKQVHLHELLRTCEQMRTALMGRGQEREKLEQDIVLAVRKGKDDIARLLIRKRMVLQSGEEDMTRQLQNLEEERQRLTDTLNRQQEQYELLKIKTGAFCRQAEERAVDATAAMWDGSEDIRCPAEEEVEMALLRYKESLSEGGAS